jgi:hypothetical protein
MKPPLTVTNALVVVVARTPWKVRVLRDVARVASH